MGPRKDIDRLVGQMVRDALLRLRECDVLFDWDVRQGVDTYLAFFPEQQEAVLQTLSRSPIQGVRELVPWFRKVFLCKAQSKDHEFLRRTSSLQTGTRLMIFGDRSAQRNPWWLNGREHYKATFVRFVGPDGSVPLAYVELDDELDMTSADGCRQQGRYALLNYLGPSGPYQTPSAAWQSEGTVTVRIV